MPVSPVPSIVYLGPYQYDLATDNWKTNSVGMQMISCLNDSSKCNSFDLLQNYAKIINFSQNTKNSYQTIADIQVIGDFLTNICSEKTNTAETKAICRASKNFKAGLRNLQASVKTREQLYNILSGILDQVDNIKPQLLTTLKTCAKTYQQSLDDHNTKIVQATTKLTNYVAAIETNSKTIGGLQQKIKLALKVLNGEGNRLQSLTKNLATYRAQNAQHDQDRVPIGLPYLNPFFTMSNRNYVIMMLVFIVLLVIGIFVYAFVGRRSTV